jgi:hypothetical protein
MNPQLSRKEELQQEIEIEQKNVKFQEGINAVIDFTDIQLNILNRRELQARLDERIRAEQDFLKMIDEKIEIEFKTTEGIVNERIECLRELKSTIKETKE